jgi:hypothetical protein
MRIPFKEEGLPRNDRTQKQRNAIDTIRRAQQHGINHIDTARNYGNSEKLVGMALQELGRDSFYLTTKIPAGTGRDKTRKQIAEACQKMHIDHIDIVDVHGINTEDLFKRSCGKEGTVRGIFDAIDDGVVSYAGFSSHAGPALISHTIATGFFSAAGILYWLTYPRNKPAVDCAQQRDCGILILSPTEKAGKLYAPTPALERTCAPFSPLEIAHRWLLSQPAVSTIAIGAATPAELDAHMAAVTGPCGLDTDRDQAVHRFYDAQKQALGDTACTLCYQCMPCPHDVQIPEILRLRNLVRTFDMTDFGQMRYNLLGHAGHWFPGRKADHCTACGACIHQCPEGLDIPRLLADTHALLEGKERQRLWDHTQ